MTLAFAPRPVAELTNAELELQARFLMDKVDARRFDWPHWARPEQLEPADYLVWLILAGRGFGKTRTGAETVRRWAKTRPGGHFAVIAKNDREVRRICFEAKRAGLVAVIPDDEIARGGYRKSSGDTTLTLKNGTIIRAFSAEQPDNIRGYAFDGVWMDEFAAWSRRTAQDVWDNAMFTLRESPDPHVVVTTTPKNVEHVRELLAKCSGVPAKGDRPATPPEPGYVITRGRMEDNRENLSPAMVRELERAYAGTRTGRQELDAEMLIDVEHALWTLALIAGAQWRTSAYGELPERVETVTSVDPSGSEGGDATGIVTLARARAPIGGELYVTAAGASAEQGPILVLSDVTRQGTPDERYGAACLEAYRWGSGVLLYEGAYGGDNIAAALKAAWEGLVRSGAIPASHPMPRLIPAPTRGSKADRAQAVVPLYEQTAAGFGRIFHAQPLPALEDEMSTWESDAPWSPNRMDALVHGVRYLMGVAGYQGVVSTSAGLRIGGAGGGRRLGGLGR